MEYILYILIVLGIWLGIWSFIPIVYKIFRDKKNYDKNLKKENITIEDPKKIELDKDVEGFESIEIFNPDTYIKETFLQIFHAVKVDQWDCEIKWSDLIFKKDSVILNIKYSTYGNFKIKEIKLTSGYNNYYYNDTLDIEVYRFFYEVYSKLTKEQNELLKKKTKENLLEIDKVLGKDTIRDSKIDWLLNGE